jgi:hypothetical protein
MELDEAVVGTQRVLDVISYVFHQVMGSTWENKAARKAEGQASQVREVQVSALSANTGYNLPVLRVRGNSH